MVSANFQRIAANESKSEKKKNRNEYLKSAGTAEIVTKCKLQCLKYIYVFLPEIQTQNHIHVPLPFDDKQTISKSQMFRFFLFLVFVSILF